MDKNIDLPIRESPDEWHDAQGNLIQLCSIHELIPVKAEHVRSVTTIGGYSLCRHCVNNLIEGLRLRNHLYNNHQTVEDLLNEMVKGIEFISPSGETREQ